MDTIANTFNPEKKGQIIWLASYPKTGNTWVRFLLANLLYGKQENTAFLQTLIPDLHNPILLPTIFNNPYQMIKTHLLCTPDHPLLDRTIGCIYIIRHPLNILLSNYNYLNLARNEEYHNLPQEEKQKVFQDYIDSFLSVGGDPRWKLYNYGNLNSHTDSWLSFCVAKSIPLLVLKYEDIKANTFQEVRRICKFLGVDQVSDDLLEIAIEQASFKRMREIEETEIKNEIEGVLYSNLSKLSQQLGLRFINQGLNNVDYKNFTTKQLKQAQIIFKDILEFFDYEIEINN